MFVCICVSICLVAYVSEIIHFSHILLRVHYFSADVDANVPNARATFSFYSGESCFPLLYCSNIYLSCFFVFFCFASFVELAGFFFGHFRCWRFALLLWLRFKSATRCRVIVTDYDELLRLLTAGNRLLTALPSDIKTLATITTTNKCKKQQRARIFAAAVQCKGCNLKQKLNSAMQPRGK